jgi:hypothetical protein
MAYIEDIEKQNEELQQKLATAQRQVAALKSYNKIRIPTIENQWCDRDIVIMHAVFTVLTEFVEKEWKGVADLYTREDYRCCKTEAERRLLKHQNKEKKELYKLYLWWKNEFPKLQDDPMWHIKGYKVETKKAMRVLELRGYLWT